jgi:Flp pilus assembly protein TadG
MTLLRAWPALRNLLARARRSRRAGTVAVMTAMSLPVILGSTGFTVDVGIWYEQQSALQAATDAGAMKAARDLASNPAVSAATLQSDAAAAANAASASQFNLTSANFTVTQLADHRQVQVGASIPGLGFFSKLAFLPQVTIRASSVAGVSYTTVSNQAVCYAFDSYNYLYSTGLGTIDTSHSAGIDPFKCGSPPSPPSAYNQYCGGGVLGCSLDLLNAGNLLLPFAFTVRNAGGAINANLLFSNVSQTLNNLLFAPATGTGSPTVFAQGSAACPANICTIPAGTYNGGITIGPGVTIDFTANAGSHTFLIENGDFVVSTQAQLSVLSDPNATFFMGGTNPGGFISETQVAFNVAPLNSGSLILTSSSTFTSSSIAGTQTSAPISAMPYAQQEAQTNGLLSTLGLPAQNLLGTNFESVIATCAQAASTCASPDNQQFIFQTTLLPSLGSVSALLPGLTAQDLLLNENEVSTTTVTSGLTIANGVATDWSQQETASSTLTNTQTVTNLLHTLGVPALLTGTVSPLLQGLLNLVVTNGNAPTQTASASGVVSGQASNGSPSCVGQNVVYSNTIAPGFGPGFSDILNSAGQNGAGGAVSTSDTITICGTSTVAAINPIGVNQVIVASSAAGSSTLSLLR